jgi:uncharacterized protein
MVSTGKYQRAVEKAAAVVQAAGGRIVGRTRLQKIAYLLELAGLGDGFTFTYRHYGPYSEDLTIATEDADKLGLLKEEEHTAEWGGTYSIFTTDSQSPMVDARSKLAHVAVKANAIELELAATAAFLASQGSSNPWEETKERKPEKAQGGRLENAQKLYRKLLAVETPVQLPKII